MKYHVKKLGKNDLPEIMFLDRKSGCCVEDWVRYGFDSAWGVFCNNFMIGYCSVTENKHYRNTKDEKDEQRMVLDNVFILSSYRNNGAASFMIDTVLQKKEFMKHPIFIMLLYEGLEKFYKNLGFKNTENMDIMVKPAKI